MNIKNISPTITQLESLGRSESKERVRAQDTTDRDANGRQEPQDQQPDHEFNESEWQEAIEKLKKLPAVLKNNLDITPFEVEGKKFVKITSPTGDVLRRLSENEVWITISQVDSERPKGQLLDKAI